MSSDCGGKTADNGPSNTCENKMIHEAVVTAKGSMATLIFTVAAPVLALGWTFLPYRQMAVFLGLFSVTFFLPVPHSKFWIENDWVGGIYRNMTEYLRPFKFLKTTDLDPTKPYVIGWHPHGRLFIGVGALVGWKYTWFPEIRSSTKEMFIAINDAMFKIPFIGYLLFTLGLVPCNKWNVKKLLKDGHTVAIIVGGIDEVMLGTYDDRDVLYLKKRKGFAKIAMDSNAGLVPVYVFGENSLFEHTSDSWLSFWRHVNKFAKIGAPFPIIGRWGLPIAKRGPMYVVMGTPIFAKEGETLDEFHERYMEDLKALFAAHVGHTADPKRKLVIA